MAGPKSASRKLSTKEVSEMVNQQSPKEKVQRKIQMIDAIAQPPRHAKNRGISVTTINKMSEPKVILLFHARIMVKLRIHLFSEKMDKKCSFIKWSSISNLMDSTDANIFSLGASSLSEKYPPTNF